METEFIIKQSSDGTFYIGSNKICSDGFIAKQICLDVEEYRNFLITEFNGNNQNCFNEVYFSQENDANRAKDWVDSMFVANKLTNKRPDNVRWV
jgi:hypothetical protein